ncbi:MAG: CYTH and CHAD domain-containing protein [Nitrospira sp.]|nr:CYTH and CHAD domain-containing protein [Nitrospira sp.]
MSQTRPARSTAPSSTIEREIKLCVDSDFRLPDIPGGIVLPRRRLTSTYYDTAAHDLAQARITLRHRSERGKTVWQLKIPLGLDRQEVELADRHDQPPAVFRELLALHLGTGQLVPVATVRVWRTGLRVRRHRAPMAEIALDSVAVLMNGCVTQRFRELEIEQRGPDATALEELEQLLRRTGARDHDGRPKLFRALSLASPAPDVPPAPDAPVAMHVRWALAQQVRWLLAHDPGTRLGTEPESLHQMRVATRRLRAVLRAARPVLLLDWAASLQGELSWLGQVLGPARDLDVQIAHFTEAAAGLDVRDRPLLVQLVTQLRSQRDHVHQVLLTELNSARYVELIRRIRQAAHDPAMVESPLTLHDLASGEFKKLRRAVRQLGTSPKDAALHEVRIKTKRARYAAELALWSAGKPASRFIKRARAVQDRLGTYQDALQAEVSLRAFLKSATTVRDGFVIGRLVERQRARRETVRKELTSLIKRLLKQGKNSWG